MGCCTEKRAQSKTTTVNYKEQGYVEAETFFPEGMAGCNYLLKLTDKNLEPLNLADSLRKPGVKLWLKYHHEPKRMSVCMMGEIVTVDDVKLRD